MDPKAIIKGQEAISDALTKLYTELVRLQKSDVASEDFVERLRKFRLSFKGLKEEFENNDKELQLPSHTLGKNSYFTTSFVEDVRGNFGKFEDLYQVVKNSIIPKGGPPSTSLKALVNPTAPQSLGAKDVEEKRTASQTELADKIRTIEARQYLMESEYSKQVPLRNLEVSIRPENRGLIRRFQYVLSDLETKIEKLKSKDVSVNIVREKYKIAEAIFMEYMEQFPDDELTECFYSIRDLYSEIPGIERQVKSLPFSLPQIDIPIFTGKFIEWDTFSELFEQLIIDQPISNTQKMCILKSKLTGEAAGKISKLPAREDNFDTAWNILKETYSNNRATTSIYFKSLLDAPQVSYNSQSVKRFVGVINESLQALGAMKMDAKEMHQAFVCFVLQRKMDDNLRIQFEQHLGKSRDIPKVDSLMEFLKQMHYSLEASQQFTGENDLRLANPSGTQRSWDGGRKAANSSRYATQKFQDEPQCINNPQKMQSTPRDRCPLGCTVGHLLYRCSKFRALPIKEKWERVKEHNICSRCLNTGHFKKNCLSNFKCGNCSGEHHSLLHKNTHNPKSAVVNEKNDNEDTCMLLSTAVAQVKNSEGNWVNCRILLDSGSQLCLMTKTFKNKLKLSGIKTNREIEGLSKNKSSVTEKVGVNLRSRVSDYKTYFDAFVINTIVSNVPEAKVISSKLPKGVQLADPEYNIPKGIDMLIGVELFFDIISSGKIKDEERKMIYKETKLGWIVSGSAILQKSTTTIQVVAAAHNTCEELLQKFWEVEEFPQINKLTVQEAACEEIYEKNVTLEKDGKFRVKLPFIQDPKVLGNSQIVAKRRFFALERKLERDQHLKEQYHGFLKEYLKLGHMKYCTDQIAMSAGYYLPHHCVLRPDSTSTKLRVVFDASCKTTANVSLNDILHTGPRIQEDLFNILLRFRKHRYVFSADIEKMFRQIWVSDTDKKYQLIYWRWCSDEPIKSYALQTVTYGTASAPYLAVKCLEKISELEGAQFPKEAEVIRSDFYMDDLMSGGDCLESVRKLRVNIDNLLLKYGMPLRKWCSNDKFILEGLDSKDIEANLDIEPSLSNSTKALGIMWNPVTDIIGLKIKWEESQKVSKRTILSDIAKLFDPLGLVSPVVVSTKILLQELWRLKINWDDEVPAEILSKWGDIKENFLCLDQLKIPRHIIAVNSDKIELHGFCDASMKAYGAAIYIRSVDSAGNVFSKLAASKSRVAPVKILTLPRLELCAAVVLVELMNLVVHSLKLEEGTTKLVYYSDSAIVLSWLRVDPGRLQIFVSNRVNMIQCNSEIANWRHVRSEQNPADLISRGLLGKDIIDNRFWFDGPQFLLEKVLGEQKDSPLQEIPELKKCSRVLVVQSSDAIYKSINHRNNFQFLQNVLANVLKFINLTRKGEYKSVPKYRKEALNIIFREIQNDYFAADVKMLRSASKVSKSSDINTLCPLLDSTGVIRVGGRLENSDLPYNAKHPILLPYNSKIVELLVEKLHVEHLHVGPQGLLAILRQQFWPLRGRQLVKKVVSRCYRCFKVEPRRIHQLMGNLPEDRVVRTRPFLNVGIDFLGPITIHHKIRGKRTDKSYVCVFVCFATKAAHLEVVSDLSSAAFIGALKRFVSRRGCPMKIYSDNGTNFIGAANSLNEIFRLFSGKEHMANLGEFCGQREIEWLNIPARSPHVGGLWEACVKSVKKHFYRVTEGNMTYEELCTLMSQIESVLNSRPLTPISDDPNDFKVLTPANFLVGEWYSTFPDAEGNKCYQGMREHWKSVQSNFEAFWKRWSEEYLTELQKRYKWNKSFENIQPGTLVLLKEDNLPPLSWKRGRVIRTIMGSDGLCRMVDVRTSNGETKRSVHNVCPFPTEENTNEGSVKSSFENITNSHTNKEKIKSYGNKSTQQYNRHEKRNKNMKIKNKNVLLVCLSMLAMFSPVKSKVEITNFKNKAGIFFEEVATVGLTKTAWDIVIHINISEYGAAKQSLDEAMKSAELWRTAQPGMFNLIQCQAEVYRMIENQHDIIMASTGKTRRPKRSFLPFIGGVYHSLFGLMDEEHAEALTAQLKTNEMNNKYLLGALRNQSSVQDMTIDIIKQQNAVVFKDIKVISDAIKSIETELSDVKKQEAIIVSMSDISARLAAFAEVQKNIIAAIFNSGGSFLSTILPVKKFKAHMAVIKNGINSKLSLPSDDPIELAKVSRASIGRTMDFILVNIRVPLQNSALLKAYAIYSYPIVHDGLFIKVRPSSRYLLIDEKKTIFYSLNEDNFNHCQQLGDHLICPQVHPLYNTFETKNCEVQCFIRPRRIPEDCEIAISKVHNYWQQTQAPNVWIFSTYESTHADVKCSVQKEHIVFEGAGLLKIHPDCNLETADVNLWAYDAYTAAVDYVLPTFNLSIALPNLTHLKLKADIEVYKIPDIPKSTTILGFPAPLNIHHLTHYGISFTSCIVIIVIIIALIWVLRKLCEMTTAYLPATIALPRLR